MENFGDGVSLLQENYKFRVNTETGIVECIEKFTWKTENHLTISLTTLGPSFISIETPDRTGEMENILVAEVNFFIMENKGKGEKINWTSLVDGCNLILSHCSVGSIETVITQICISVLPCNTLIIRTTARSTQETKFRFCQNLSFNFAGENLIQFNDESKLWTNTKNVHENQNSKFFRIVNKVTGRVIELQSNMSSLNLLTFPPSSSTSFSNHISTPTLTPDESLENILELKFKIQVKSQDDQSFPCNTESILMNNYHHFPKNISEKFYMNKK